MATSHPRGSEGIPWEGGSQGASQEHSLDRVPADPGEDVYGRWPTGTEPLLSPPSRVGGRLQLHATRWSLWSNDEWVTSVVSRGYKILFKSVLPPTTARPVFQKNYADEPRRNALQEVIHDYIAKGALVRLQGRIGPGFYSRVFLVPKRSGRWRMVIDLHALNQFTLVDSFKMESVESIRQALRMGEWAASIDLTDAYLHIPMHPLSWRYIRFALEGEVFEFRTLPFGLAAAPYVFTRVMKSVSACCHRAGLRFHAYLDDSLCPAATRESCQKQVESITSLIRYLGFLINIKKSELTPSQEFTFLGVSFNLVRGTVCPAPHRLATFRLLLGKLTEQSTASPRDLHRLLGHMESFAQLLPGAKAAKRELQMQLIMRWDYSHWDKHIPLTTWFKTAVASWLEEGFLEQSNPLHSPKATQTLYTDACNTGWGAHLNNLQASGKWCAALRGRHINYLEMEAVLQAVNAFAESLKGQVTLLRTDNSTVAAYINKEGGGARSQDLCRLSIQILQKVWEGNGHLIARHIRGKANVLADSLSRKNTIVQTEWTIHQATINGIFSLWGKPHIDLFATRLNRRLPIFVSPVPDPLAESVDALTLDWTGLEAYAFPPPALLGIVLRKIQLEGPVVILLAPNWPAHSWFPLLLSLLIEIPVRIPVRPDLLTQPQSRLRHQKPEVYKLHAWKLSSNPSARRDFLNGCPPASLDRGGPLLREYTNRTGVAGWIGQSEGRWIPVIH